MASEKKFVAVALGASSGRMIVGQWDGRRFSLDKLHRFPNGGVSVRGRVYRDALRIWGEIQNGLLKFQTRFTGVPDGIAVDAWDVDFGLLDRQGHLLENPVHYRDGRTLGTPERAFEIVTERDIFVATGA